MKLIGLMPVRNEAHELGLTLRAALQWCDEVVCLDHASTDNSAALISEIHDESGNRVWWRHEPDPSWNEMEHRQRMLEMARIRSATHIALIDADEIATGNMTRNLFDGPAGEFDKGAEPWIRTTISAMPKGSILQIPLYNLRGSLDRYHANGVWGNRWLSVTFADDPKLSWSGDKFHDREPRYPDGSKLKAYKPIQQGQGGVMHLWGASERRLTAKHALYKVTERLRYPHKTDREIELTYNDWRSPEDNAKHWPDQPQFHKPWTFTDVPAEWWSAYEYLTAPDGNLDLRGEPWQEAEVRRLVREHGIATFQHLDLFGVV